MRESATAVCDRCGFSLDEERSPMALPLRTLLNGRFSVGRILGKPGGYGVTYLAWDQTLETVAAIKEYLPQRLSGRTQGSTEISPHTTDDATVYREGLEQFLDEARTLIRFKHPNIVRVRDFFAENNTGYLVMDYYAGQSLSEFLQQRGGTLAVDDAIRLMMPILDGLQSIHDMGYLHRDIKPSNIYVTDEANPILLDFGAARQSLGEETESLSVILTPGYAPFEQYFRKGKQGPWTDVYSVAATLYFMVSGVRPPQALDREAEDDIQPLTGIKPQMSRTASDAIMAGLETSVNKRPRSADEFKRMLSDGLAGRRSIRVTSHPIRWVVAATALLLLGVSLGAWWMSRSETARPEVHADVAAPTIREAPASPEPERERLETPDDAGQTPAPSARERRDDVIGRRAPPDEARNVCANATVQEACTFDAPHGPVRGRCLAVAGGGLACVPDHHRPRRPPPPPPR